MRCLKSWKELPQVKTKLIRARQSGTIGLGNSFQDFKLLIVSSSSDALYKSGRIAPVDLFSHYDSYSLCTFVDRDVEVHIRNPIGVQNKHLISTAIKLQRCKAGKNRRARKGQRPLYDQTYKAHRNCSKRWGAWNPQKNCPDRSLQVV